MNSNDFTRIRVSEDATNKLKLLKSRTGLTPNIICRIALCYSLEKENISSLIPSDENGQEFNRHTLTGNYDNYIISLVKQRCVIEGIDPKKEFLFQFKAHLNNGILILHSRIKNLSDLADLMRK